MIKWAHNLKVQPGKSSLMPIKILHFSFLVKRGVAPTPLTGQEITVL